MITDFCASAVLTTYFVSSFILLQLLFREAKVSHWSQFHFLFWVRKKWQSQECCTPWSWLTMIAAKSSRGSQLHFCTRYFLIKLSKKSTDVFYICTYTVCSLKFSEMCFQPDLKQTNSHLFSPLLKYKMQFKKKKKKKEQHWDDDSVLFHHLNDTDILIHTASLGSSWQSCAYKRNANGIIGYVKLLLY